MDKKINYTARSYKDIRNELISFSKKYYPEIVDTLNDASVGQWLVDLVSAVGDSLNYAIDRAYQETNVNSSNMMSSILNNARANNVKVQGPKCSMSEVEISCVLPVLDDTDISSPDFSYAPLIKRGSTVGNGTYQFSLSENCDFGSQFNSNGISNRKYYPNKDGNGNITGYTVTKSEIVVGGTDKIYKKVLTKDDVYPFMEIVLPEQNIACVNSIIFKESGNFNAEPQLYEFFIDEEVYKVGRESIDTYRYFEVNSLSDQYIYAPQTEFSDGVITSKDYTPSKFETYDKNSKCYYKGEWKPIVQKFITEYTDNEYLKIIFGSATETTQTPSAEDFNKYTLSKIMNNEMLGILPRVGWTMFVHYTTCGGSSANLAQGSINRIINASCVFPNNKSDNSLSTTTIVNVKNSLNVTNISTSMAGKDSMSSSELKYYTKYAIGSQERCVTLNDYKARILAIPPKFGCPFRLNGIEDNNKIVIPMLGLNSEGELDNKLPQTLVDNIIEYLSHYKTLGDYIELVSGKIYNLGFQIDAFVDKNYTTSYVVSSIIDTVKRYMDVNNFEMGESIFLGDLEKEINLIDGVISLIDLRVYAIRDGIYSKDECPLPIKVNYNENCEEKPKTSFVIDDKTNGKAEEIDLDAIDHVLYNDYNSMFEIKNPETDIQIRVKLK